MTPKDSDYCTNEPKSLNCSPKILPSALEITNHSDSEDMVSPSLSPRICSPSLKGFVWQHFQRSPRERMCYILDNKVMSDITLVFEDDVEVKAHKLMLAMYSPVYATMFYGSVPHGEKIHETTTSEIFAWISAFIYKGVFLIPNIDAAIEIYIFAHQKEIKIVVEICSAYLLSRLKLDNVFRLFELAILYEDIQLKGECTKIIYDRRQSVFLTKKINVVSRAALCELVSGGHFRYTEKVLFRTVLLWAIAQIEGRGEKMIPSDLRKEVGSLLPLIDFTTMTEDFLIGEVFPTKMLTSEEGILILRRKRDPKVPLPKFMEGGLPIRKIRLQNENSSLHRISLIRKAYSCNFTFMYNHNNVTHTETVLFLKSTERVYLSSVKLKDECFTGSWRLYLTDQADRQVGEISSVGPPWNFELMIPLAADTVYVGKVCGRGKFFKHNRSNYEVNHHGIHFSGTCLSCHMGIVYWV